MHPENVRSVKCGVDGTANRTKYPLSRHFFTGQRSDEGLARQTRQ